MVKFIQILTLTIGLAWAARESLAQTLSCESFPAQLESYSKNLKSARDSLEVLFSGEGAAQVPLAVLFQTALDNSEAIKKRKNELAQLVSADDVLKLPEFADFTSCAKGKKEISDVKGAAEIQAKVNERKFTFFNLSVEKRETLIAAYQAKRERLASENMMAEQLSGSQAALQEAQASLSQSEKQSTETQNKEAEPILVAQAQLDKFLVDLESEHITFINELKAKGSALDLLRERLNEFNKPTQRDADTLSARYSEVRDIWAAAVDEIFILFSAKHIQSESTVPVKLSGDRFNDEAIRVAYLAYAEKYDQAIERSKALVKARSVLLSELKAQNFRLLKEVGSQRASMIALCDSSADCMRPTGLNEKNLKDIGREIRVLPLRLFAGGINKWLEVKGKINGGWDSWIDLSKQFITFFVLLAIPFLISRFLRILTAQLDGFRSRLLARSMIDYRRRTRLAVFISRINPFIPSIGMIVAIYIARRLIETTDLFELSNILFYLQLYFVYRAVRIFLKIGLEIVFSTGSVDKIRDQQGRIERTSARLSRLYFIRYGLLHLIEDTVRHALVYNLVATVVFWITVYVVILEFRNWRAEITESFDYRFPDLWRRLQPIYALRIGSLILPALLTAVVAFDLFRFVSVYLVRMDIVKRVLAEVLRRKLERAEAETKNYAPPPEEYLALYDYYLPAKDDFYVNRRPSLIDEITHAADSWGQRTVSDDLIIVVGNRGMGKSTLLERALARIQAQSEQKVISRIPPRTTQVTDLFMWLSDIFKADIRSVSDFAAFDNNLKQPMFVLVDDIHNLFLGTIGGFEAYKVFIETISLKTKNLFWCLTVNSRAWAYLNGVFGFEHFYGRILELTPWRDFEIQELILSRHKLTGFSRSFDESIRAYGAGESLGQQAEAQFFRLLWGQSRGNPRSALMYWVSAVTSPGSKEIHVGVPSFMNSGLVSSLSDDALFLLAGISRHESLTYEEMRETTGVSESVIRKCMKEAYDKKLVWSDSSERIRISSRAQYLVDYFLIGKNFLYE